MKLNTIISLLEATDPRAKSVDDLLDLLDSIVDGKFTKDGSKLKVGFDFYCDNNQLESLKGCPQTVGRDFYCDQNQLKSLEGCPQTVGRNFYCRNNQLESLKGCPQTVGGGFNCSYNKLKSLVGCPQTVGGGFNCSYNQLTSLSKIDLYIHEIYGEANFMNNPIKSNVLGLLKIRGLKKVEFDDFKLEKIINKYLPNASTKDIDDCKLELIEAGLEEFAKL